MTRKPSVARLVKAVSAWKAHRRNPPPPLCWYWKCVCEKCEAVERESDCYDRALQSRRHKSRKKKRSR